MPIACLIHCTLIGEGTLLEIFYNVHFWRSSYLLCVANKRKITVKVDRERLFAANALAAYAR
jgi:hypothetical protein